MVTNGFGAVLTQEFEVLAILTGLGGGGCNKFPSFIREGGGGDKFYCLERGGGEGAKVSDPRELEDLAIPKNTRNSEVFVSFFVNMSLEEHLETWTTPYDPL